jgi:formylglycine-generating enzyme
MRNTMTKAGICRLAAAWLLAVGLLSGIESALRAGEPKQRDAKPIDLGGGVKLEVVYIPPGQFMMGSTREERVWSTGMEGGWRPGSGREEPEGYPRSMRVKQGFWMGRTEVSVGQFRRFAEEGGYVTDAEKPGGQTQCYDPNWIMSAKPPYPWQPMKGKSWRDPTFPFALRDVYPVVCVSWNDARAFCAWLTEREHRSGRLPEGMEYRLPTEAEWEYACRGGRPRAIFWWGEDFMDGEGRLNISAIDVLPGRNKTWPLAKAPWSDGFAFVSPVDNYGERGRNGFGLADMLGGVWEIVLDHFDSQGGHEEPYFVDKNPRPVCRGGNYYDVPGNVRCAVRLGLRGTNYSDSRDGFRICLGRRVAVTPSK